jgi:hypothetical protein
MSSWTINPGIFPKCRGLPVTTSSPRDKAVEAISRSEVGTLLPAAHRRASISAKIRATGSVMATTGSAESIASTNSSRRARRAGVSALQHPWRSSPALMAEIASSTSPQRSRMSATSCAGVSRFLSARMRSVESISSPKKGAPRETLPPGCPTDQPRSGHRGGPGTSCGESRGSRRRDGRLPKRAPSCRGPDPDGKRRTGDRLPPRRATGRRTGSPRRRKPGSPWLSRSLIFSS